ncbi:MAG: Fic family protein [Pseudomonadales bacterium]|jgi:Fic family protein
MARQVDPKIIEQLLVLISQQQNGLSVKQLQDRLEGEVASRNLQRWLAGLAQTGKLEKVGRRGQGVFYRLPSSQRITDVIEDTARISDTVCEWVLSPLAQQALERVSRPLGRREPVGYRREFLGSYQPNHTWYLPESVRVHLQQQGRLPQVGQPAGTYARHILQRLLIDLSWNSSRLEGNTYSLLETEQLILQNEAVAGKNAMETQMILNHKDAIEFLVNAAGEIGFNVYTIRNLHALLSNNLLGNPEACGRIRQMPVTIGGSSYTPTAVPALIQEMFAAVLEKAESISDPFEQSFFSMVHLSYLQAFDDVNKRVSRLAANIPFIRHNLCPLSFVDMPQDLYVKGLLAVYEMNSVDLLRDVFVHAYEHSVRKYSVIKESLGEPDMFRLQYRNEIAALVNEIVIGVLQKAVSLQVIKKQAKNLPQQQQARFIEVVETELQGLHEGNIARYRITPSQYRAWRERW